MFAASVVAVIAAALLLQAVMGLPYQPRFSVSALNYWAVAAIAVAMPTLLLLHRPSKGGRRSGVFPGLGALLAVPCAILAVCSLLFAPSYRGNDLTFEPVDEVTSNDVAYRLYFYSCTTCSYGLELRAERELPLGVKLVSPLWSRDETVRGRIALEPRALRVVDGTNVLASIPR